MDKNNPKSSDADAKPGKDASHDAVWRYEVPEGDAGAGTAESNSGHYTGAGGGVAGGDEERDGGFLHSDPENNVVAPGAPQSGRGSAAGAGQGMGGGAGGGGGGAGGGEQPSAGAGAGAAPGTPKGNGSKDEPIWGS